MVAINRDFHAYLDEMQVITVLLPYSYYSGVSTSFYLRKGKQRIPLEIRETIPLTDFIKYVCSTQEKIEFGGVLLHHR